MENTCVLGAESSNLSACALTICPFLTRAVPDSLLCWPSLRRLPRAVVGAIKSSRLSGCEVGARAPLSWSFPKANPAALVLRSPITKRQTLILRLCALKEAFRAPARSFLSPSLSRNALHPQVFLLQSDIVGFTKCVENPCCTMPLWGQCCWAHRGSFSSLKHRKSSAAQLPGPPATSGKRPLTSDVDAFSLCFPAGLGRR